MRFGCVVAIGVLVLGTMGCRSKPAPVPPATGPLEFDDDSPSENEPTAVDITNAPVIRPQGCGSGTPWNGKHEGCLYEVGGCCYPDARSACAAAGCPDAGCQILESSPAQIGCRPE